MKETEEITKNNKGWFIEMKIPYSAIRFPKKRCSRMGIKYS